MMCLVLQTPVRAQQTAALSRNVKINLYEKVKCKKVAGFQNKVFWIKNKKQKIR